MRIKSCTLHFTPITWTRGDSGRRENSDDRPSSLAASPTVRAGLCLFTPSASLPSILGKKILNEVDGSRKEKKNITDNNEHTVDYERKKKN